MVQSNRLPRPLVRVVEVRKVLVADEDDDRRCQRFGYANPLYEQRSGRSQCGGWHPPFNQRTRDGEHLYAHAADFPGYQGTRGYFEARLSEQGDVWRIRCWGADDTGLVRDGLSEAKARGLWQQIRDHLPMRSLVRLGFQPD